MKQHNLTYSVFARKLGIGIKTAKGLYEDPYHNLRGSTLIKCAEFFRIEPGQLIVEKEETPAESVIALGTSANTPQDSELIDKLFALLLPESLLSQAKKCAGKGLVEFVNEAIAEKLERESINNCRKLPPTV